MCIRTYSRDQMKKMAPFNFVVLVDQRVFLQNKQRWVYILLVHSSDSSSNPVLTSDGGRKEKKFF